MNALLHFIALDPEQHFLLPPAEERGLLKCEAALGWKLPASYREFLRNANGALLYESDELFGATALNEGIGCLTDFRSYVLAQELPDNLWIFNDDGRDTHAFEMNSGPPADPPVVHWSASARAVGQRYRNLAEWVDLHLSDKWAACLAARRTS